MLKPYQVGEYDVVAASSKKEALVVLCEFVGKEDFDAMELDEYEVIQLSSSLELKEEDGKPLGMTLGELVATKTEPCYLYGWE